MGTFSDSPGAIYPALRRLEQGGLVRAHIEDGSGLRRRRVFRLTSTGILELKKWMITPVSRQDVVRGMDGIMLRFAFMDLVTGDAVTVQFLKALEKELKSYLSALDKYFKAEQTAMPRSGRLALESGIRGYRTQLQWARHALATYKKKKKGGKG